MINYKRYKLLFICKFKKKSIHDIKGIALSQSPGLARGYLDITMAVTQAPNEDGMN